MDINSLIANYLKNTNNTEINASEIKDTFYNLANDNLEFYDSIFVYGEEATKEELIEYMSKACGKDGEQFKKDVGLLFDVLNSNSDDDVLTADELKDCYNEQGKNEGSIDGFGIWNELLKADVSQIEAELANYEVNDLVQEIIGSNDVEGELADYALIYGEDSDEYKELEAQVRMSQSDSMDSTEGEGRSQEDINRIAQSIVEGQTTLERIASKGILTDDELAQLEEAIRALEAGEYLTTEEATTPDASTPEATTPDATTPEATTPEATTPDAVSTEAKIPDDAAKNYAIELLNGISLSSHEKIREYLDLDSADLVKVISLYSEEYGSITKFISTCISGDVKKEFINTIMSACIEQAKNGNEEAIKILCNEIYSATAQTLGYTGYEVLDAFFNNADNDVITLVKDNYSKYIEGHELREDINGERMRDHPGNKTFYIAKIDKAWQEET